MVSPMRLNYYRNRWYLDAWCHEKGALRSFNIENIRCADIMQMSAKVVPMKTVQAELDRFYGLYRSGDLTWARIRFAGIASKIASQVVWHPDQMELWLKDDLYELTIPYSGNSPELVGDILRYGPAAKVVEPESLKNEVREALAASLKNYDK